MMYKFKLELGDWSNDGHGKYETFVFESNKCVEELREIYFINCQKYGKLLETTCGDYNEYTIGSDASDEFKQIGINLDLDYDEEMLIEERIYYVNQDNFIDLFIQFMKLDSIDLQLELTKDPVPTFHFYGFDEKNRHIGCFGYGLFD